MRVSTADFIKGYGAFADRALTEPVTITKNGRDRLVLLSAEEHERLRRRDRRAVRPEDLSDADLELVARAEVPAEYAHLDALLEGWTPPPPTAPAGGEVPGERPEGSRGGPPRR